METKNAVSGAVVLREVPFSEWMQKYATQTEKEEVQFAILTGVVPQNAVVHRDKGNKVFMEVPV